MDALLAEAASFGQLHQRHDILVDGDAMYTASVLGGKASTSRRVRTTSSQSGKGSSLADKIAATRAKVEFALDSHGSSASASSNKAGSKGAGGADAGELKALRKEVTDMRAEMAKMQKLIADLQANMAKVSVSSTGGGGDKKPAANVVTNGPAKPSADSGEDDDDFDPFASDEEEDDGGEKERIKQERLAAYAAKKAKKPGLIAKSSVIFDVKPWDDETDMSAVEAHCRSIEMDGLLWGAGKLVPLAYGIKKLQIMCVVEDEKVSVDELQEKIEECEDLVQSVDIAAFNKI